MKIYHREKVRRVFEACVSLHTQGCCSGAYTPTLPCRRYTLRATAWKTTQKVKCNSTLCASNHAHFYCLSCVSWTQQVLVHHHLFVCQQWSDLSCGCRLMNEASCSWTDISLGSSSFDVISSTHSLDKLGCPFLTAETLIYAKKQRSSSRLPEHVALCVCLCVNVCLWQIDRGIKQWEII